jgi:hypothetical protein
MITVQQATWLTRLYRVQIKHTKYTVVAALLTVTLSACNNSNKSNDSNDDHDDDNMMTGGNEAPAFAFNTAAPADYKRVDRSGMPAIAAALIASKDSYNQANPTDDSAGALVPEISASLDFLHTALDGQLQNLG